MASVRQESTNTRSLGQSLLYDQKDALEFHAAFVAGQCSGYCLVTLARNLLVRPHVTTLRCRQ